jgi:hypothetical protein
MNRRFRRLERIMGPALFYGVVLVIILQVFLWVMG